jgi:hypothetical protein
MTVTARERPDLLSDSLALLRFSFDRTRGNAGETLELTITRAPSPASTPKDLAFEIVATSGGVSHSWLGVVGTDVY